MRVLLVNPPATGVFTTFGMSLPPMGLLYIAASLERAGHEVIVKDLQVEPNAFTPAVVDSADLVGISSDTTRIDKALQLARMAAGRGKRVVMGGPHPQFTAAELLATGAVDYIVKGEGEPVFPRLLAAIERRDDPSSVAGLIYRDGERTVETPAGEPPDVEELPLPARHLVDLSRYSAYLADRQLTPIVTSRGCPGACRFCSSSSFFGVGWRCRSAESVLLELDEVYQRHGYRAVAFTDDNFTLSPARAIAIADGIRQRGYDLKWWNFSRVDTIVRHPEMVEAMAAAGSAMVYLGIESGSAETLAALGKGGRSNEAEKAVRLLARHGIESYGSYILGNLTEDRESVERTIDLAVELDTNVAQFTILTPYPGTSLYDELKGRIFCRRWKFYDGLHLLFRHPRLNRHRLQWLLLKAYIRFYRRSRRSRAGFALFSRRSGLTPRKVAATAWELFF